MASVNSEFAIPRRPRGPDCLNALYVTSGPPKRRRGFYSRLIGMPFGFVHRWGNQVIQELLKEKGTCNYIINWRLNFG